VLGESGPSIKHTWPDVRVKSVVRSKADVTRLRDVSDVLDDLPHAAYESENSIGGDARCSIPRPRCVELPEQFSAIPVGIHANIPIASARKKHFP
jgi:hypothetical protein